MRLATGIMPIVSSCIPITRPCNYGFVIISIKVVCKTAKGDAASPISVIRIKDSGIDEESANTAQSAPHVAVAHTKSRQATVDRQSGETTPAFRPHSFLPTGGVAPAYFPGCT